MTKIEALKKTVYNLENDVYEYKWTSAESCNCGVLARTILNGKTLFEAGFFDINSKNGRGCFAAQCYCMTTAIELPLVFKLLKETGFSYDDLLELEFLGNRLIAERAGFKVRFVNGAYKVWDSSHAYNDYEVKENLIKYIKAWIEILEEQEHNEKVKIIHHYVEVDKKIKEIERVLN